MINRQPLPRLAVLGPLLGFAMQIQAGSLDHFSWDTVPASPTAGSAFTAQLSARDSAGSIVTGYAGSVTVTATSALSPIVVTEVAPGSERQFEIQNISSSTVNTTGWFVRLNDTTNTTSPAVADMNSMNATTFALPASMTAGQIIRVTASSTNTTGGRIYFGSSIAWSNVTGKRYGWVGIFDSTSTLRDIFLWGWTAAYTAQFSVTVNSQAIVLNNLWTGAAATSGTGAPGAVTVDSFQRSGTADNNTSADWAWKHNSDNSDATSLGSTNTGLTLPFATASAGALSVTPSTVTLTSGVFSGTLAISAASAQVALVANDGAAHTGTSALFTVSAPPPLSITTTSPLNYGVTGTAYSQTLAATGGTAPYAWTVSGGSLPGGLSFSAAGVLSGTPTTTGTFNFTLQVTDGASMTATRAFTAGVFAPSNLAISTSAALTAGYAGTAYSQTFAATSGTAPYTWELSSGTLPAGLSLSSSGALSGTPTAAGAFSFTLRVTDNASGAATKTFILEIFLLASANNVGIPTPTDTTTYTVTDSGTGASVQVPMSMVYVPSGTFTYGPSKTTPVVPATSVTIPGYCIGRFHVTNAEFFAFITATGSTQYIPSTGVTPTAYWVNGTYPAGKGNHPVNFVSLSAAKAYAAWVSQKTGFNVVLPTAYMWEKAARGPNSYSYPWGNSVGATYSNGVLTANLNFNANVTSYYLTTLNTPYSLTPAWTSNSTLTFSNSASPYYNNPASPYYPSPMTVSSIVAISNAATPVATALAISSSGNVAGYVDHNTDTGFIYTDLFAAINNAGGYTTPVGTYAGGVSGYGAYDMAGNLWNWTTTLFVAANGAEANANANQVRGGSWYATSASAQSVDIGEGRSDGNYNSVGFRIAMILPTTTANLSVTTTSLTGVVSTVFSQSLTATGGSAPYNWTTTSGTLPAGLALSPAGLLSGTPTTTGIYTVIAQAGDSGGLFATQSVTINIVNPLAITSTSPLAVGTVGVSYAQLLAASGGLNPLTWTVSSGTLPAGLSLSTSGVLSGTPTSAGSFSFAAQAADSGGQVSTKVFAVTIGATGVLHHFTWNYLPGTINAGAAFAARLTARDTAEGLVTTYNGSVNLSASGSALSTSTATFSSGEFIGRLTLTTVGSGVVLTASDGSGHTGTSSSFTVSSALVSTAGDGIPDAWKTAHGFSVAANIATLDSDGDGMSTLAEYLAGTDPQSASSRLAITSQPQVSASQFSFTFSAVAGIIYRVSSSSNLHTWTPLSTLYLPLTSGAQTVSFNPAGASSLFVRVEIAP